MYLSKYGEARHIYIAIPTAGSANHAVGATWTPAAGDVKISKDGGAAANVTNLPTAIAMGNSAIWDFSLTATEMQAAQIVVTVADSATKAVDDTGFSIETYGNASAQHAFDLDTSSVAQTGDNYARLGAPAGASVSADVAAVKTETASIQSDTNDIQTRIPAALTADGNIKADSLRIGGTTQTGNDIGADVNDILADTNELQTDWVNGGRLDLILDARASQTSLDTLDDFVDTEVAAILAAVDTEVAAILADTGTDGVVISAATQNSIRDAIFARAFSAAYGSYTFDELQKQFAAVLLGKANGLETTTATYRNLADSADVIVATVDADGNRTAVTRTP